MEIKICVGSACHLRGATEIIKIFNALIKDHNLSETVDLKGTFCLGKCQEQGVSVMIGSQIFKTEPSQANHLFQNEIISKLAVGK